MKSTGCWVRQLETLFHYFPSVLRLCHGACLHIPVDLAAHASQVVVQAYKTARTSTGRSQGHFGMTQPFLLGCLTYDGHETPRRHEPATHWHLASVYKSILEAFPLCFRLNRLC
jgi:hypothetical protein